jgi:hypothetical protein
MARPRYATPGARRSFAGRCPAHRCGGDGLDVARPERAAADVELPLHDGCVRDDLTVDIDHEMQAPGGVLPVVVGERLLGVRPEGLDQQRPDRRDLGGGQFVRR